LPLFPVFAPPPPPVDDIDPNAEDEPSAPAAPVKLFVLPAPPPPTVTAIVPEVIEKFVAVLYPPAPAPAPQPPPPPATTRYSILVGDLAENIENGKTGQAIVIPYE
jgi:hypothetical protein